jgi:hypothetical protein
MEQFREIRRSKTRHGIPSFDGSESVRATTWILSRRNVVEGALERCRVDLVNSRNNKSCEEGKDVRDWTHGRVDEAHRFLVSRDARIVDHGQHGADDRSRYRSAKLLSKVSIDGNDIVGTREKIQILANRKSEKTARHRLTHSPPSRGNHGTIQLVSNHPI